MNDDSFGGTDAGPGVDAPKDAKRVGRSYAGFLRGPVAALEEPEGAAIAAAWLLPEGWGATDQWRSTTSQNIAVYE